MISSAYCSSFQHIQRRQEWVQKSLKISATKGKEYFANAKSEEQITQKIDKKKGTVAGAVALIIGTSIGSGILALPQKTSPAVTMFLFVNYTFYHLTIDIQYLVIL